MTGAPLRDVTVLDFTRNLAGPYCTMVLGDLGARVIKVERPEVGDDTRHWRPPDWEGSSAIFVAINRNKESVVLDLDSPEGVEAARRLAAEVDVVIESNKPGSMERRSLGFEAVRELNPQVVYCSVSAFGAHGPQRDRAGYDTIVQAASGVMSINGEPGRDPVRVGPSIIDQATGMWAALGVVAALRERDRAGVAQHVQTSLLETGVAWMSHQAAGFFAAGSVPGPQGTRNALAAPYEPFRTSDGTLFVATLNDNLFARMCDGVGLPALADDERFRTNGDRVAHRDELHAVLEEVIETRPAAEWESIFLERGVPCSPVRSIDEVVHDPQVEALGLVRPWPHPVIGDCRLVDHPISYNGVRSFRQEPAPDLGAQTEAVLREYGCDGMRPRAS